MFSSVKTAALTSLISVAWLSSAQAVSLNLDFGNTYGAPASSFGAASGQVGVWNDITDFTTNSGVVDTSGAVTGVIVEIVAATMNGNYGSFDLMNDNFYAAKSFGSWSLTLSGLNNGVYDVYVYEPANTLLALGRAQ